MVKCPNCGTELEELGHVEDARGNVLVQADGQWYRARIWAGDGLWACRLGACRYPHNRFVLKSGKPTEVLV